MKPPALLEMLTSRRMAAAALLAIAAVGAWQAAPVMRSLRADIGRAQALDASRSVSSVAPLALAAAPGATVPLATVPLTPVPLAPAPLDGFAVPDSAVQQANTRAGDSIATAAAMVADSIVWTPAVARTWVNVRSDASRGGEVVGVIKPAARALLGTDRAGWRQVRSTEVSGWVDPRLFEPDSAATREP